MSSHIWLSRRRFVTITYMEVRGSYTVPRTVILCIRCQHPVNSSSRNVTVTTIQRPRVPVENTPADGGLADAMEAAQRRGSQPLWARLSPPPFYPRWWRRSTKAAGLVGTLSSPGPFTVFAPNNAAFAKVQSLVTKLLLPKNKAALVKLLKYHVLAGKVMAAAIKDGQSVATIEGQNICFEVNSRTKAVGIYECGSKAEATNVITANIAAATVSCTSSIRCLCHQASQ